MKSWRKRDDGGGSANWGGTVSLMPTMKRLWALAVLVMAALACTEALTADDRPLYDVLGVAHNATFDDIAEAYERHAESWSTEKRYKPAELEEIIEIEHAYQVVSHYLRRRDYDYFRYDPLQAEVDNIKKQYEGRAEPVYVEFPLWTPKALPSTIESTAETVTYQNFGDLVLHSSDTWLIQIYSVADPACHEFAPAWDRTVN